VAQLLGNKSMVDALLSRVRHYCHTVTIHGAELMEGPPIDPRDHIRRLLEAYRATPGTSGVVRRPDRLLAAQLHERGVPLEVVENPFILATTRRSVRPYGRGASEYDSLAGLFLAGARRGLATECWPGILSAPPPQTPTHCLGTLAAVLIPEQNSQHGTRLRRG
jgi:hypothetical protein